MGDDHSWDVLQHFYDWWHLEFMSLSYLLYGTYFAELRISKVKQKNKLIKYPVTARVRADVSHPLITLGRQTEGFPMFPRCCVIRPDSQDSSKWRCTEMCKEKFPSWETQGGEIGLIREKTFAFGIPRDPWDVLCFNLGRSFYIFRVSSKGASKVLSAALNFLFS